MKNANKVDDAVFRLISIYFPIQFGLDVTTYSPTYSNPGTWDLLTLNTQVLQMYKNTVHNTGCLCTSIGIQLDT